MNSYWFDYVKSCYDLVIESEGSVNLILEQEVEAYVVHMMANNFVRTDIGSEPLAIKMFQAVQTKKREDYLHVADEALLIHSYPLKKQKWPCPTYYQDLGIVAYGLAGHIMEENFVNAGRVINGIFKRLHNHGNSSISC